MGDSNITLSPMFFIKFMYKISQKILTNVKYDDII